MFLLLKDAYASMAVKQANGTVIRNHSSVVQAVMAWLSTCVLMLHPHIRVPIGVSMGTSTGEGSDTELETEIATNTWMYSITILKRKCV